MATEVLGSAVQHNILLSLGSNVGESISIIAGAARALEASGVHIVAASSIYFTEPRGRLIQPWFYNSALLATTPLSPRELLSVCLEIERLAGRVRDQTNGPRTLDIDIVFIDSLILKTDDLVVPHPRFLERRFVLEPMAEIAPDFCDPSTGKTLRQLLDECLDPGQARRLS